MKQTSPDDFSRAPRCHRKYWKTTELKQWPLYYSLLLLHSKLPPLYWHHFSLLVSTIHILLKDKITLNEIDAADMIFKSYSQYCMERSIVYTIYILFLTLPDMSCCGVHCGLIVQIKHSLLYDIK